MVSNFYGTEIEIWAGFEPVGKKSLGRLSVVFQCLHGQSFFNFFDLQFMQLFSADATILQEKKMPMKTLKNWPKTSPNLNFCSIKIAHHVTNV